MGYQLNIGDQYIFDWNGSEDNDFVPEITPMLSPRFKGGLGGSSKQTVIDYYVETWRLTGLIYKAASADIWTEFNTLADLLMSNASAGYDCTVNLDGTTQRTLSSSNAIKGLQYTELEVVQGPGTWTNNIIFNLTVTGKFPPSDDEKDVTDVERRYEVTNEENVKTERWTVTASGPGARDYIASVTAAGRVTPSEEPWTQLEDAGYTIIIPKNCKTTILQESFDRDTWTGIFEKKGQSSGTGTDETDKDTVTYSEKITVEGGWRKITHLLMFYAKPRMALGRLEPITVRFTSSATCKTWESCGYQYSIWNRRFPKKRNELGGYTGGQENLPTIKEYTPEGFEDLIEMSTSREYIFATKEGLSGNFLPGVTAAHHLSRIIPDPEIPV